MKQLTLHLNCDDNDVNYKWKDVSKMDLNKLHKFFNENDFKHIIKIIDLGSKAFKCKDHNDIISNKEQKLF